MDTTSQKVWVEIARQTRHRLAEMVEKLPTMSAGDVKTLLEAMRVALWFESDALTFDHGVSKTLARNTWDD